MEEKMKFIAIGLAAALLISIFLNFQSCISKKALELEKDTLKSENISLNKKVEETITAKKSIEDQLGALRIQIDNLAKEKGELISQKDELQKQYDALVKEREATASKLKTEVTEVQKEAAVAPDRADAYWAGILKSKNDLALQVDSLRSELRSLKITNEQLERDKSALELDLNNLNRDKQSLEQQLASLDNMSLDLVREKNVKMKIEDDLTAIKKENSVLRRQVKYLNARKASLETKLQKLQEDKAALERRFNEMGALLENKMSQIGGIKEQLDTIRSGAGAAEATQPQAKESVELPPIVVRPQSEIPASPERIPPQTEGIAKVLEVNRKDNFIVIDLGEDYGLKIGDLFSVYRAGRLVGTIEVVQVRRGISACDIKNENTPIKVGDIIK